MNDAKNLGYLVSHAYNNGFAEGMKEYSTNKGGKPWHEAREYYDAHVSKIEGSVAATQQRAEAAEARVAEQAREIAELKRERDEALTEHTDMTWQRRRAEEAQESAERERDTLAARVKALTALLNTPELYDFAKAVTLEAAHQRERWGSDHDAGKTDPDWFWLLGYLAGKALHSLKTGDTDKALHHVITTAAACANWHAALMGQDNRMRPGIDPAAALQGGNHE